MGVKIIVKQLIRFYPSPYIQMPLIILIVFSILDFHSEKYSYQFSKVASRE
jgi:hypothetical protein